jgi:hypothetical protein
MSEYLRVGDNVVANERRGKHFMQLNGTVVKVDDSSAEIVYRDHSRKRHQVSVPVRTLKEGTRQWCRTGTSRFVSVPKAPAPKNVPAVSATASASADETERWHKVTRRPAAKQTALAPSDAPRSVCDYSGSDEYWHNWEED